MPTLLVVDDEPAVRGLVAHFLEHEGFLVLTARCGSEALSIARQHRGEIDLLISDIMMPGMDGPSLAKELRALEPRMPVLLMSGYCDVEFDRTFAFLPKPFYMTDLLDKVRKLLPVAAQSAA